MPPDFTRNTDQTMKIILVLLTATLLLFGIEPSVSSTQLQTADTALQVLQEKHLKNITQLTFGGENAEAYFSADGRRLIFQSTRDGRECDQIYLMNVDGSGVRITTREQPVLGFEPVD